jgi:hypothetical protein
MSEALQEGASLALDSHQVRTYKVWQWEPHESKHYNRWIVLSMPSADIQYLILIGCFKHLQLLLQLDPELGLELGLDI